MQHLRFWFLLSLAAPLYFGIATFLYLSDHSYIVQDDARQHVVFLQQYIDPDLFQQNLIADYFTSIAPGGYKFLYWVFAQLGIAPIQLAKLLPIGLSLITTGYLFFAVLQLLPVPMSAWIATLVLNQQLWMNDDLVSATPRAFVYPIFCAFLYAVLKQSIVLTAITIALQGLFFPQLVFVQVIVLVWRYRLRPITILGLLAAIATLLTYALDSSWGTAITAAQMRSLPEYGLLGRNEYFGVNGWQFCFLGNSGVRIPWFPSIILVGLGLPFLKRFKLPLLRILRRDDILTQVLLASLIMFGLAHLFLLKLHFPSRYTYHTLRIVLAIATSMVITILLNAGWQRWQQQQPEFKLKKRLAIGLLSFIAAVVIIVPAIPALFLQFQGWVVGHHPALYQYLAAQPKDTLIASLDAEANSLPTFTHRSTFVGREFALPHHPRYYNQFRQRIIDLIQAQYSSDLSNLISFIQTYGVDFLLVDRSMFTPNYLLNQDWLIHSSFQSVVLEAIEQLKQEPALLQAIEPCQVVESDRLLLIDANCIVQAADSQRERSLVSNGSSPD